MGGLLHCPSRRWQSAPTSGHVPWSPKGEGGMPSWLASHAGCGGRASATRSRIWPPLPVLRPIPEAPRFPCPALHPRAHGSIPPGRAVGPAPRTSWQHRHRAGASGHRDALVPIHVPASPGTKPCSSRQEKLGKSGHKAALCWALLSEEAQWLIPGWPKKGPTAGTPWLAPQQYAPSPPCVSRVPVAAEAGAFAFWDGAFPRGEVGGGEEGTRRAGEPGSPSRSGLLGRLGWLGGAAGPGWLLGSPEPPARPDGSSPGPMAPIAGSWREG